MDNPLLQTDLAKCTVLAIVEDAKEEETQIKTSAAKCENISEVIVWDVKNKEKPTKKFQVVIAHLPTENAT